MESPFLNINSPINCWKGYQRVPGTAKGAKGSCRKSPAKMVKGGGTKKSLFTNCQDKRYEQR
jgi:hypothetical protein